MHARALTGLGRHAGPLALAALAFTVAVAAPSADPDTFWHLASGRWMLDHGTILRGDVFSATVRGTPYALGEWLGEVGLASIFQAGGWAGLAIARAALVAVAAFALARLARRGGAPPAAAFAVAALALAATRGQWADRPALVSLALVPVVLELLFAARAGRRLALVAIPPLLLLWAQLHAGYVLGLALILAFAVEAVLLRRRDARALGLTLLAATALSLLDPETFGLAGAAGHVLAPPRYIVEELPPDVLTPAGAVLAGFLLATLAIALRDGAGLLDLLLILPLGWLALSAQRHAPYLLFAATPLVAAGLGRTVAALPRPRLRPLPAPAAAGLALLLVAGALASALGAPQAPDERSYPAAAVPLLRAGSGTLLHEYDWGGYLIFRVPERPVFVDGRLFPYLPTVLRDYRDAVDLRPDWRAVLARYDVRSVLLRPDRPLAVALREDGWRVAASGPVFVLLERP